MIRDQELLLPAHEYVFPVAAILVMEIGRTPRRKSRPSLHVVFVGGSPILVAGLESVSGTNYLSLKAGGQGRMFRSEAFQQVSEVWDAISLPCLPSIFKYPQIEDSDISTVLMSTSTLYLDESDC